MQNYPYMQMVGQGPYRGYPPAPQYAPQEPPKPQSNVDWVQVAGYEAAKSQQVFPGCVCWMRDTSDPYIYAKSVDMMGTPKTEMFRIERVEPGALPQKERSVSPEDFAALEKRLNAVEDVLRAATAQPAPKRTTRKAEEEHE